jgi:hypothetical protein
MLFRVPGAEKQIKNFLVKKKNHGISANLFGKPSMHPSIYATNMVDISSKIHGESDGESSEEWEAIEEMMPKNTDDHDGIPLLSSKPLLSATMMPSRIDDSQKFTTTNTSAFSVPKGPPELRQRINRRQNENRASDLRHSITKRPSVNDHAAAAADVVESSNRLNSRRGVATTQLHQHPLQHFVSHFGYYLCSELVNRDWNIRLAVLLVIVGMLFQTIHWSFWYILYPEQILWYGLTILLAMGIPIAMLQHQKPMILQRVIQGTIFQNHPFDSWWVELVDILHPRQLQFCTLLCLYVIPALLEIRTLHFLSNIVSSGTSIGVILILYLLLSITGYYFRRSPKAQLVFDLFRYSPRACTQIGLYVLYGIALGMVLLQQHASHQWRHVPQLAARFCLATAVILWKTSATATTEGYCSDIIQTALRRTVRDALQHGTDSVEQDEMLQLAMMRWIVDFWSASSTTNSSSRRGEGSSNTTNMPTNDRNTVRQTQRNPTTPHRHSREIEWTELWSMLQTTTVQMASEANALQAPENRRTHDRGAVESPPPPLQPTAPRVWERQQQQPPPQQSASSNFTSESNENARPTNERTQTNSLQYLQSMLASMDIDDRAKPAVQAYRHVVEAFPPSLQTAIVLACTRQCPAMQLVALYGICSSWSQIPVVAIVLLIPFITVECRRMYLWYQSVRQYVSNKSSLDEDGDSSGVISTVQPMTLLLMDERYCLTSRVPPLLLVWQNICASVSALEVGLTAARCVQTTVVAADFASNVLSLVDFGYKVAQHGWMHGLSLVALELLHLHTTRTDVDNITSLFQEEQSLRGAKYTGAAINAVRNSQKISRNIQALMEEENRLVGPLLAFIPALIGYGWLWGHDKEYSGSDQIRTESTVVIEEIREDEIYHSSSSPQQMPNTHKQMHESTSQNIVPVASSVFLTHSSHGDCHENSESRSERTRELEVETSGTKVSAHDCISTKQEVIHKSDDDGLCSRQISQTIPARDKAPSEQADIGDEGTEFRSTLQLDSMEVRSRLRSSTDESVCAINSEANGTNTEETKDISNSQDDDYEPLHTLNNDQTKTNHPPDNALSKLSIMLLYERNDNDGQFMKNLRFPDENGILDPEDDDFAPLQNHDCIRPKTNGKAESRETIGAEFPADANSQSQNEICNDGDNLLFKIGGGLAIVGAVVAGGIALANANKRDDQGKDSRNNKSHEHTS